MTYHGIDISPERLAGFCRQNHIKKLSLFGSILRADFRPESDVDMLVEFEAGHRIGFIGISGLELELSKILGRKVDLRTAAELSRYFREEVVKTAEVQYAA